MADTGFSLLDITASISRHRRLVLGVTILATVVGILFYFLGPKCYEAKTEFIVRNPLYADRNNLYNTDTKFLDYFGSDDDVDRIILLAGSDIVQAKVIAKMDLAGHYKIDTTTRKGSLKLEKRFDNNLKVVRTKYRDLVLSFTDEDPAMAAAVANECVLTLEHEINAYYNEMRSSMIRSVVNKMNEEDSTINVLTDTLAILRKQYGIYDIISPARYNIMLSSIKDNGRDDMGKGIEQIQNIEAIKDALVSERAKQTALVSQYTTGSGSGELPIIKVVTPAKKNMDPKGLGAVLTILVCALLGFVFSTLYVLIGDGQKRAAV